MKYQIQAPTGIWTNKTVLTPLNKGRYLTVKLSQGNLQAPIIVELAEIRSHKVNVKHYLPVALSDVEVIDRRDTKLGNPLHGTDTPGKLAG